MVKRMCPLGVGLVQVVYPPSFPVKGFCGSGFWHGRGGCLHVLANKGLIVFSLILLFCRSWAKFNALWVSPTSIEVDFKQMRRQWGDSWDMLERICRSDGSARFDVESSQA